MYFYLVSVIMKCNNRLLFLKFKFPRYLRYQLEALLWYLCVMTALQYIPWIRSQGNLSTGWTIKTSWFASRQEQEVFASLMRPDRLRGPPSLLPNGYRRLFPGSKAGRMWIWPLPFSANLKMTGLVPRLSLIISWRIQGQLYLYILPLQILYCMT
jgi:hypothetical protein